MLVLAFVFFASLFMPLPEADFRKETVQSLRIVDRNDVLLREYLNDSQGRGQWRSLKDLSPALIRATIAVEDKRFRYHPGIDPIAILRSVVENIRAGKLRSGGSTISQQVIRNVYQGPRTLFTKIAEAWYALRLERMMSKDEILEQYLNRVPYGNQLVGAEAAARHYFDKPARYLSTAEAAFLAGLPNAPSFLNPYSRPEEALKRQKRVLRVMMEQGLLTQEEYSLASSQPVVLVPPEVNFRAPHLVEMAARTARQFPSAVLVRTTIDYSLQKSIQWLIKGHLKQLQRKNVNNAAVVVLDNKTMEVVALVGSADYFHEAIQGQVNGALASRQPGSAVKPFTYALAFEGPMTAADIIPDIPTRIPDQEGDYIPENYDRRYHGPVRMRTALACSYNIPAVRVLQSVGRENLLQRMLKAGLSTLDQPSVFYGYGLTLGNGEVTLLELTQAYALFARGGRWQEASFLRSMETTEGISLLREGKNERRVFSEQAVHLLTDILKDSEARRPAFGQAFRFPFDCAVKTGTTKDYRDNWTVGYTTSYTVGVWAGNFDGSPMRGVSGVSGAGRIFEDIMMLLHVRPDCDLPEPFALPAHFVTKTICAVSGQLRGAHCTKTVQEHFMPGRVPALKCEVHRLYRFTNEAGARETKVFEVLPQEYREWAHAQGIPAPPYNAVQVSEPQSSRFSALALLAPQSGQLFKVDPILRSEYQTIRILAHIPSNVSGVKVRVNDRENFRYDSDGAWWKLQKGEHRFQLEGIRDGKLIRSKPVFIAVE